MNKPIPTRAHAVLDLVSAGAAILLPRMLNCNPRTTSAITGLALSKLAYGIMTRHELGLVKKIPMKAHLALDAVGGVAMGAVPLAVGDDDPAALALCVGLGAFDLVAAPLTQTTPSIDHPSSPEPTRFERQLAAETERQDVILGL